MPLQRRIPKRGFTPYKRHVYQIVNVGELACLEGTSVNAQTLRDAGLIRSTKGLIKILAMGELSQAYSVEAHKFSGGAAAKIEAAGGSVTTVGPVARPVDQAVTPEPAVKAEPAGAPEVEVAPEPVAEPAAEAEPAAADPEPAAEAVAEAEPAAAADPEPEAEPVEEAEPAAAADSEPQVDPEPAADPEPVADSEPGIDPEPDSAPADAENDG